MARRDFQYFISIAETGGFSKAAMAHNIAQSALSRRICELGIDLGVTLFYRNGRGVIVTGIGETFLTGARRVLAKAPATRAVVGLVREHIERLQQSGAWLDRVQRPVCEAR